MNRHDSGRAPTLEHFQHPECSVHISAGVGGEDYLVECPSHFECGAGRRRGREFQARGLGLTTDLAHDLLWPRSGFVFRKYLLDLFPVSRAKREAP